MIQQFWGSGSGLNMFSRHLFLSLVSFPMCIHAVGSWLGIFLLETIQFANAAGRSGFISLKDGNHFSQISWADNHQGCSRTRGSSWVQVYLKHLWNGLWASAVQLFSEICMFSKMLWTFLTLLVRSYSHLLLVRPMILMGERFFCGGSILYVHIQMFQLWTSVGQIYVLATQSPFCAPKSDFFPILGGLIFAERSPNANDVQLVEQLWPPKGWIQIFLWQCLA